MCIMFLEEQSVIPIKLRSSCYTATYILAMTCMFAYHTCINSTFFGTPAAGTG